MPDNLDLAPPPKLVDGLLAVPIDIQNITATLTFDSATQSGNGDATLDFITGAIDGNPIFDLRQTITAAWLNGSAFAAAQLSHHDFGGGIGSEMRVVESVLPAGSAHTLRVTYNLGLPQASTAGTYQPQITWMPGNRLVFNFGFTDLGPGRYLEAWVPANLIFDQFNLTLEIRLINTTVSHSIISNGNIAVLSTNHWSVMFPSRSTAFTPLLEIRPTDTLENQIDTLILPVSGTHVTIDAWKLAGGSANLATEINNIKTFLTENENSVGPYVHGNRFVAFMNVGGMEYDRGTTTSRGPLRHEVFHSWWGRGLKPASQRDAWWDEAWTEYNTGSGTSAVPFDFTDPPVELSSRNPWVRQTPRASYTAGRDFFQGIAAMVGTGNLNTFMREFYTNRNNRPATTTDLEEFLVCRLGESMLVDAFHRFVYGFGDPSPLPNLWLRDAPGHTGADEWTGGFWDSPDLWIRNTDDNGTDHQQPEFGQDNWFYARVRNHSTTATARHFLVTFNVKQFAGTQFVYPGDFLPCVAATSGFDLGPSELTVVKVRWPRELVPPSGTHACLLATVLTRNDHPVVGRHVWEHNNLAQKNLTVVNLRADDWMILPFIIANLDVRVGRRFRLELVRTRKWDHLKASLLRSTGAAFKVKRRLTIQGNARCLVNCEESEKLDCGTEILEPRKLSHDIWSSRNPNTVIAARFADAAEADFDQGIAVSLPIYLRRHEQLRVGLRLHVPKEAKPGDIIRLHLVQRGITGKRVIGGLAIEIHVQ